MDLQTRKLHVIEYLINLKDEGLFQAIEDIVNKSKLKQDKPLKKFTPEELIKRAKQSNDDYNAGRFIDQKTLEKESENW